MEHIELVLFGLLVAVAGLAVVARLVRVPYPILLTVGGLAFGFVPGMPEVELDPELVLLIFLPPLLYAAAFFSNLRELRDNWRPIGLLAIGLVIATMVVVAAVAHYVIDLEWPVAFVLGAVVSPTDAVAPAAILRRLGVPRRVISVVEGENLTNDWTALVAYKFAVAAVVTGSFSLLEAGPEFMLTGLGGIAIGVVVGIGIAAVRRRVEDPVTEVTISLLTAYAAYLPAEELGASGVLAAVTVGRLARMAGLGADHPHHPDPAVRGLGGAPVPAQRVPVRADRAAAAGRARRPERPPRRRAGRLRRAGLARRDRRADGVGLRARRPAAPAPPAHRARARPRRRGATRRWSPGAACAAGWRWPPRWRSRWRPTPARPSPSAT